MIVCALPTRPSQDPVQSSETLGPSASALNSRLQALRDVTNSRVKQQSVSGKVDSSCRNASAKKANVITELAQATRLREPIVTESLFNSRAAAVLEHGHSASPAETQEPPPALDQPQFQIQQPLPGYCSSPDVHQAHPDIRCGFVVSDSGCVFILFSP